MSLKVAFLGPRGTFTEEAASLLAGASDMTMCPYPSIPDVLDAVSAGHVNVGVVPLENSIEGSVHSTLDSLLQMPGLCIIEELVLTIQQNLLSNPGASRETIFEVWSHPQALAQCRAYLRASNVQLTSFDSTASAATAVRESGRLDVAAIGTAVAAKLLGLDVVDHNIQDTTLNQTRFAVVSKYQMNSLSGDKTMLVITPQWEHVGVLASLLHVFAALNLNLSWIESRPTRTRLGTYQFFVDIDSGIHESQMQTALQVIQAYGHDVRVLGSYSTGGHRL